MSKNKTGKKSILYITFLGILEPVAYSQVFSYLTELSREKDFKFTLISLEKPRFINKKGYLKIEDIRRKLEVNNVEWRILRHRGGAGKIISMLECMILCIFLIIKNKVRLIYARSNEPAIIAYLLSKIFRVKIVYDRRGMMGEDYTDDATTGFRIKRDGLIYRVLDGLERRIIMNADALVVLTEKIFNHIIKDKDFRLKKDVITIIPCCANFNTFKNFKKDNYLLLDELKLRDKYIINYTGSLCDLHSLPEMLSFFKSAKKLISNAHFMFLTMVDRHFLVDAINAASLDIKDFTIVSTSPLKVNEYLAICDVAIMFFKPTLIRLAASPTKFAECLASGLPVIINKHIGDTEELIKKNKIGVVVEEFSEKAYNQAFKALMELAKDPDLRQRCRQVAELNFPVELGAKRYGSIYRKLLN